MMKVYAAAKQFAQICSMHDQLTADGLTPDDAMYGQLIKFAVHCGRIELARTFFRKAKNPDIQNYMSLIRACGKVEKNVGQALELLEEMESAGSVDTAAYNCVLDVCVTCNDASAAKKVFDEMKHREKVDVISYNTLMKFAQQRKDGAAPPPSWANVEILLEEMRMRGLKPTTATYNSLLAS